MRGSNDTVKMGNCFPFVKRKKKGNREITLAILGLDNAGKTTTTRSLQGESLESVAPTIGFENIEFSIDHFNVTMFDLGGGRNIRAIWQNYFSEVHGVVYVVDASEPQRLNECRDVLTKLISHPRISGKPLLLLANKQDLESALDDGEILEELDIENTINQYKCPCRVERCSATIGIGKKMDKAIRTGFQWLLGYIDQNLVELDTRVKADIKIREEKLAIEREERRERVRRIREEREREEKESAEVDEEKEVVNGDAQFNPFKPLTVDTLSRKNGESAGDISKPLQTDLSTGMDKSRPDQLEDKIIDLKLNKSAESDATIYSDITGSRVNTSLFITSDECTGDQPLSASQKSLQTNQVSPLSPESSAGFNGSNLPPLDSSPTLKLHKKKKKRKSKKNRLTPAEENLDSDIITPSKRYSNPNLFLTENITTLDKSDGDKEVMDNCNNFNTQASHPLKPNADLEEIIT